MTRHAPNHACVAATLLRRPADFVPIFVSHALTLAIADHYSSQNRQIAHRHRNKAGCRRCRGDSQAGSCISRIPQSP